MLNNVYLLVFRQICDTHSRGCSGLSDVLCSRHNFISRLHLLHHLWVDDHSSAKLWFASVQRPHQCQLQNSPLTG